MLPDQPPCGFTLSEAEVARMAEIHGSDVFSWYAFAKESRALFTQLTEQLYAAVGKTTGVSEAEIFWAFSQLLNRAFVEQATGEYRLVPFVDLLNHDIGGANLNEDPPGKETKRTWVYGERYAALPPLPGPVLGRRAPSRPVWPSATSCS
jgi:hypothetical protein